MKANRKLLPCKSCPYCGSPHVTCDTVEIGVGEIQCGPLGCEDCHAVQIVGDAQGATEEEAKIGWWKPMSPSEAEAALDAAEGIPLSEERIAEIVRYATREETTDV